MVAAASRAVPPYAMAALLLLAFAVLLPVFPLSGATTAFADYDPLWEPVVDVARHLALPGTSLTLFLLGSKFLLVRNTTVSALGEDYMLLARAKGLPTKLLKYHHAGRNALLPFVTMMAAELAFVVGPLIAALSGTTPVSSPRPRRTPVGDHPAGPYPRIS